VRGRRAAIRCGIAGILTLALTGLAAPATQAHPYRHHHAPDLTVMTRNLYLGASLTPAVTAPDTPAFLAAVAGVYGAAQLTSFPVRAEAIADEIAANQPDVIGLQEVTRWETSGPGVPPSQDFLAILQTALAERHLHYQVAATSDNANIGPVPLVKPCASAVVGACLVTLKDRDVLLVSSDTSGLRWRNARHGNYVAQQTFTPPIAGATPVSFNRGWVSIDGSYRGKRFHLASTHLETADVPAVQVAQAAEFLAGPARGPGTDIALGDFNSAADGSTTATYSALTEQFRDAWLVNHGPGVTCCQDPTLANTSSALNIRIDLVLSRRGAQAVRAHRVGLAPFQAGPPLWPSDHAGVVATLRLR
jgi:endonuclease/exonuclease/phosphatase family metal-dependent hydrolase